MIEIVVDRVQLFTVAGLYAQVDPVVVVLAMSLAIAALVALILIVLLRRRRVATTSSALAKLTQLNSIYAPMTRNYPPLQRRFAHIARSKAKFDRFDLPDLLSRCLLEQEQSVQSEIDVRLDAVRLYAAYALEGERLGAEQLGASSHPKVASAKYLQIETKLFERRTLPRPNPRASVRGVVSYRSPKGQNSYERSIQWGWDETLAGLESARARRDHQSTSRYLRQQERALMSDRLRVQVLRRDEYRCRMCGASARSGAELHIDHIRPVSLDGRTQLDNLQVLCKACNLGKSNTFIG